MPWPFWDFVTDHGLFGIGGVIREADRALADNVLNFLPHPRPENCHGPSACSSRCLGDWHVCVTACLNEGLWERQSSHLWRLFHAGMIAHHSGFRIQTYSGDTLFSLQANLFVWIYWKESPLRCGILFSRGSRNKKQNIKTPFNIWNCRSFSVWALISSNFESLTERLLYTVCTWISIPSLRLVSWSDNDFLDNGSVTGMSLPGRCSMVKLYFWSWRITLWSLGGTDARGFHFIDSRGVWLLSKTTWRPWKYWWKCLQPNWLDKEFFLYLSIIDFTLREGLWSVCDRTSILNQYCISFYPVSAKVL